VFPVRSDVLSRGRDRDLATVIIRRSDRRQAEDQAIRPWTPRFILTPEGCQERKAGSGRSAFLADSVNVSAADRTNTEESHALISKPAGPLRPTGDPVFRGNKIRERHGAVQSDDRPGIRAAHWFAA